MRSEERDVLDDGSVAAPRDVEGAPGVNAVWILRSKRRFKFFVSERVLRVVVGLDALRRAELRRRRVCVAGEMLSDEGSDDDKKDGFDEAHTSVGDSDDERCESQGKVL